MSIICTFENDGLPQKDAMSFSLLISSVSDLWQELLSKLYSFYLVYRLPDFDSISIFADGNIGASMGKTLIFLHVVIAIDNKHIHRVRIYLFD